MYCPQTWHKTPSGTSRLWAMAWFSRSTFASFNEHKKKPWFLSQGLLLRSYCSVLYAASEAVVR
jgi:hypothetical protein